MRSQAYIRSACAVDKRRAPPLCCLAPIDTHTSWGTQLIVAWFFVWRLAYNLGLGVLLQWQSKSNTMTKWYRAANKKYAWMRRIVQLDQGAAFVIDDYPDEFIAWLLFRRLVDVVLACDLVCYFAVCIHFFEAPTDGYAHPLTIARYVAGVLLSAFALWSKSDAYRVIGT